MENVKEDERVAVRGIILCTIIQILALLFFYVINL